jgi:hypothetical protein
VLALNLMRTNVPVTIHYSELVQLIEQGADNPEAVIEVTRGSRGDMQTIRYYDLADL